MPKLIEEKLNASPEGHLVQRWQVAGLRLTIQIPGPLPQEDRHFDELECWVLEHEWADRGTYYDDPRAGYPNFTALSKGQGIPFVVTDNGEGRARFHLPVTCKLQFLEALEASLESHPT